MIATRANTIRKQFTGYERDGETELDFAQARYYAKKLGRFYSSDPENEQAFLDIGSPQSWNGYAYVNNNPCSDNDPTGKSCGWCKKLKNWYDGYGYLSNEDRDAELAVRRVEVQTHLNNGGVLVQHSNWKSDSIYF